MNLKQEQSFLRKLAAFCQIPGLEINLLSLRAPLYTIDKPQLVQGSVEPSSRSGIFTDILAAAWKHHPRCYALSLNQGFSVEKIRIEDTPIKWSSLAGNIFRVSKPEGPVYLRAYVSAFPKTEQVHRDLWNKRCGFFGKENLMIFAEEAGEKSEPD